MDLDQRYPSIGDLAAAARRRIPRFAWEYLISGIGAEAGLARNRAALDAVTFRPRYLPVKKPAILFCARHCWASSLPFHLASHPLG